MRKLVFIMLMTALTAMQALAQTRTITGTVTDEKGNPVSGATVQVKGSKKGTSTSADGTFSIDVPANAKALQITSVGMTSQELPIGGNSFYSIKMTAGEKALQEVVVTSLGITRDKRSLGYATQTIKSDMLADRGEVNVVNALQGKVAGVSITGTSGSPGSSTNINIRGISSFTGSNQPLFVVDGIPISNDVDRTNGGPLGTLGDNQPANRALDLDVNNIESINVMKGPAASVLYGSRAAAGAIIITTKKGSTNGKVQVTLNSSYSVQNVTGLPEVQNEYGQGLNGIYNTGTSSSWGPKFGSTPSVANGLLVNGTPIIYNPYPNNINDFFEQGRIADNSLAINGGDAKHNYVFAISNLDQKGIIPNTTLKRTSVKFGANTVIKDKLKLGGSATFINTLQNGILGGNGTGSPFANLYGIARSIDLTSYRTNGTYKNADGTNNYVIPGVDNPYFGAYENPLTSNVYRILGNVTIGYDITSWLSAQYRLGIDAYTDRRKQIFAISSNRVPNGQVLNNTIYRGEVNGDFILTAKKNNLFGKDINITGLVGQNINQRSYENLLLQGDNLAFAGFYNPSNATQFAVGSAESSTLRRLLGYYAQLSLAYHNYLFIEFTGRADQSSTLPKDKNIYFYPSVNTSFVFTEALHLNSDKISYGKIRASATKVGRDADPYLLSNTYGSWAYGTNTASFNFPFGSNAGFGASSRIAPNTLSPEFTTSYEGGLNLGFLRNKINLDVTYFYEDSKAQIINVGLAPSTGYSTKTTNIGEMVNKGVEAMVNISLISRKNFTWDVSGNFTKINNKVLSIAPGTLSFSIPGSAFTGSIPSIKVGYPYGVILGGTIPRSPDGQYLINPGTGLFQPTIANQVLADPNPDYKVGLTNTLRYHGLTFSATVDYTKGGQVLSFTAAAYKSRGAWIETAVDRDKPRILPGVIQVAPDKYIPNNIQISAQSYWQTVGGLQSEFNVYDATVFRFREMSIGYDIPSSIVSRIKFNSIRFSIFANNIFFFAPNSILDPEVNTQGAGNIRGLDLQGAPNARTIGANLKLSF